jgi:hypothetical protein
MHLDGLNIQDSNLAGLFNMSEQDQASLFEICAKFNEANIDQVIVKLKQQWIHYNNQLLLICRLLFEIVRHYPSVQDEDSLFNEKNRNFVNLYVKMYSICSAMRDTSEKKYTQSNEFQNFKDLIQLSSTDTFKELSNSLLKTIDLIPFKNEIAYSTEFLNELFKLHEILSNQASKATTKICEISFNEDEEIENKEIKLNQTIERLPVSSKAINIGRRPSTRRSLRVISENKTPVVEESIYKTQLKRKISNTANLTDKAIALNLKTALINWLTNQLCTYFDSSSTLLQEKFIAYFCFNDLKKLKKRLFSVQRLTIHDCLVDPMKHLDLSADVPESPRKKFKNNKSFVEIKNDNDLPLSVLYKIYLECGHMINLYDWLQVNKWPFHI